MFWIWLVSGATFLTDKNRLQKILSRAGVASRRASEQLMLDGRVTVNGEVTRTLGAKADPTHDDIRVDGRRVKVAERFRYLLLNKPRGVVSTRSDPQGRPTVIDLLRVRGVTEYVYPVGRLDFESEGLILLTNDGDLAARLTHPRHELPRVYEVQVAGVPDDHDVDRLTRGIVIDGRRTQPAVVELHHAGSARGTREPRTRRVRASGGGAPRAVIKEAREGRGRSSILIMTIREGRNRQVRKMCDAIGHPVTRLRRVAIGPLKDTTLKPGHWRDLTKEEVRKLVGASAASRS
jgi:23S rRNA pseudouridine2605 synthase